MRRILFGLLVCILCILSMPHWAYAQMAEVPEPQENGAFLTTQMQGNRGTYQIQYWMVIGKGMQCVVPTAYAIIKGESVPYAIDLNKEVVASLKFGDILQAVLEPGSNNAIITVPTDPFKPSFTESWLKVRTNAASKDCFVRAEYPLIAPINSDFSPSSNSINVESNELLALDSEGLRLFKEPNGSATAIPFGMGSDLVFVLANMRGKPDDLGINSNCGAGALAFATWANGLTLWFKDGHFAGWKVDGSTGSNKLTYTDGIGVGSTLSDLRKSGDVNVSDSSLGTEFSGIYKGLLSGKTDNDKVTNLWNGETCLSR